MVVGQEDDDGVAVDADDRGRPAGGAGLPEGVAHGLLEPARRLAVAAGRAVGREHQRPVGLLEVVAEPATLDHQAVGRAAGQQVEEELALIPVEQAAEPFLGLEEEGQDRGGRLQRGVGGPVDGGHHQEAEQLAPGRHPGHQPGRRRPGAGELHQGGAGGPGPQQVSDEGAPRAGEGDGAGRRRRRRGQHGQEGVLEGGRRPGQLRDGVDGGGDVAGFDGCLHEAALGVPAVGPRRPGALQPGPPDAAAGSFPGDDGRGEGSLESAGCDGHVGHINSGFPRNPGSDFV